MKYPGRTKVHGMPADTMYCSILALASKCGTWVSRPPDVSVTLSSEEKMRCETPLFFAASATFLPCENSTSGSLDSQ